MKTVGVTGQLIAVVLFLTGGVLLLVFGIRRLMKRSRMLRAQQVPQQPPPGFAGPAQPQYARPPAPGAAHTAPPGQATKPPGLTGSIIMLIIGGFLLLGVLGNLVNAAGTIS